MEFAKSSIKPVFYPRIEITPIQQVINPNDTLHIPFEILKGNARIIFEMIAGTNTPLNVYYFRCSFLHLGSVIQAGPAQENSNALKLIVKYSENEITVTNPSNDIVQINYKLDMLRNLIL